MSASYWQRSFAIPHYAGYFTFRIDYPTQAEIDYWQKADLLELVKRAVSSDVRFQLLMDKRVLSTLEIQELLKYMGLSDVDMQKMVGAEPKLNPPPHSWVPVKDPHDRQVGGTHYKTLGVEVWTALKAWLTPEEYIGFLRGNIIKYQARANSGKGTKEENLRKANHYAEELESFLATQPEKKHAQIDPLYNQAMQSKTL